MGNECGVHGKTSNTLQVADGLCYANFVDGTVVDDTPDDDTVVDRQAYVGKYCQDALRATMD
eukprot:11160200-Lingulodinium_polyedra.AAC.1